MSCKLNILDGPWYAEGPQNREMRDLSELRFSFVFVPGLIQDVFPNSISDQTCNGLDLEYLQITYMRAFGKW